MMKTKIVTIILSRKNKRRRRKTPRRMKVRAKTMRSMMKRRMVRMNKKKKYRLRNRPLLRSHLSKTKTTRAQNLQRKKSRQIPRNSQLRYWTWESY